MALLKLNVSTKVHYSVDTVLNREKAAHYPCEFFSSLSSPGITPHKLIYRFFYNIIPELVSTKIMQWYKIANKIIKILFT